MVTDNGHLIALKRITGALVWETAMVDWHDNYTATGAPLVVGTMVVSGISGGDEGGAGLSGGIRPGVRQRVVALLDRAKTRRTGFRNLAGNRN